MFFIGRPRGIVKLKHIDCPEPVLISVRCKGKIHTIRWEQGHIAFADHTIGDLRFELSIDRDKPSRCAQIFHLLVRGNIYTRERLPKPLKLALDGYGNHRRSEGHSQGFSLNTLRCQFRTELRGESVRRRFEPFVKTLQETGLAVELGYPRAANIPEAVAVLLVKPTLRSTEEAVAYYRHGYWCLDVPRLLDLGCSIGHVLEGLTVNYTGCRICPGAATEPEALRQHIASPQHRAQFIRLLRTHFPPESFGRFCTLITT
jgi:hypothetical protein